MDRVKQFWLGLSKKVKFLLILIFGLTLLLATLLINKKGLPSTIFNDGKWDKLVLDQKYVPAFTLSPAKERKYGIFSQEVFTLKSKDPQEESFIKENLVSSKPVKVNKVSDTEFKIVPVNVLAADEVITLSMKSDKSYNWVFQAAPKLKIVDSLPRNEAKEVPVNAGIEVTFNNDDFDLGNSNVEIIPNVKFRIEKHDEKASIVPLDPLKPKTVYNVTVKKGSEDYHFSFQTAENDQKKGRLDLAKDFQEVFPDEPLITKAYANNWNSNDVVNVEVYKFSSPEEFVSSRASLDKIKSSWEAYYGEENMVNTRSLSRVLKADLKVQEKEKLQYLQLPQNLNEGLYLVQFWFDNYKKVEQLWVQSSSIAGYVSVGKLQTAVWVNSSKSEPLGSSTIGIVGTGNTYSSNGEGWAVFPTPAVFTEKSKHYLLITNTSGRELILPVDGLNGAKPDDIAPDDYWSYIYHERVLYKPNDTVYFWGVAKNRDTGSPPSSVDIFFDGKLNQSVSPLSDGSFIGKLQLTDAEIGYKNISVKVGGVELAQSYFEISDYVKPELKIEVEANKKAIYAGESVDYKARVTFFDGTPASNVELYISSQYGWGDVDKTKLTANRNGEISFKYKSKVDSSTFSYPRYEGVVVSAIKSGEGPSDGSGSVFVYGSRLEIDTKTNQDKDKASLEATVKTLDLSRVNDKGLDDPVSGIAANQKVELITTKTWYEQKQNGTYYDFVEKVTRPSYEYITHEEVMEKKDLFTGNDGKFSYNLNLELNKSYRVELKAVDSKGNPTQSSDYFYYSQYQDNSGRTPRANLNLDRESNLFSIGEEVDIKIQKNGKDYEKSASSKFLFILANRGKQEIFFSETPEVKFNYQQKYVPNVYVGSIIFNGRYYEEVAGNCRAGWYCGGFDYYNNEYFFDPILIGYDSSDSELDLSISSDKLKYQPGDEARVTVKVTKNGNAVSGASVHLTSVDEALAAIGGVKEPSILTSLYEQVSNLIYYNYYSHKPVLPDSPQAERGGGGGDRYLFKDTAFFDTGTTDSNGIATFNIKLPDNITNWLTYAQALTGSVDAGQAKFSIVATKDFFVTSQFPQTVTIKDSPLIAVSSFGNVLNGNTKVPTEVIFSKDNQDLSRKNSSVEAFKESYFEFPKLPVGNYKVAVRGTYQNFEDGIILPLKVISSRLDFNLIKNKTLDKGENLKSFDGVNPAVGKPVKLIVTDEGKGKYYYDLYRYCYQNSNRIEKRIVSIKADQIITSRFKDSDCDNYNSDLSNFQGSDGGLRQVEWGGSDLETTLWAVYIDPSPFNKEKLINYFKNENTYSSGQGGTEQKILRAWGLTLLGMPKVNELNQLSRNATTYKEKVLSALALYSAGDTSRSKEIYFEILSQYAYTNKPYLRIQADPKKVDYDSYVLDTGYALLLGTLNNIIEFNPGFNFYLSEYGNMTTNIIPDVANISYIDSILADLPDKDTIISIKTPSQGLTKNLTKDGLVSLNLKQDEVSNFNLKVIEGKIDASISYFVTPEEFSALKTDNRISLRKNVTKVKGDSSGIKLGDILRVDLKFDFDAKAPPGCYILTDHIPSGTTYLDNPNNYDLSTGQKGLMYPEKANIVKGCVYNSPWWRNFTNNTSVYFVRVTAAGKYVSEPAIMQSSLDPSIFQKTSEEYITVDR